MQKIEKIALAAFAVFAIGFFGVCGYVVADTEAQLPAEPAVAVSPASGQKIDRLLVCEAEAESLGMTVAQCVAKVSAEGL